MSAQEQFFWERAAMIAPALPWLPCQCNVTPLEIHSCSCKFYTKRRKEVPPFFRFRHLIIWQQCNSMSTRLAVERDKHIGIWEFGTNLCQKNIRIFILNKGLWIPYQHKVIYLFMHWFGPSQLPAVVLAQLALGWPNCYILGPYGYKLGITCYMVAPNP